MSTFTFARLKAAIIDYFAYGDDDAAKVTRTARIDVELGLDDLDRVELVMLCEEEFELEIGDADYEDAKTVGDLAELVDRLTVVQHMRQPA